MLPGLVIRQTFLAMDWLLVVLFLVGASFVVMSVLDLGGSEEEDGVVPAVELEAPGVGVLAGVKPRGEYDAIMSSGLFGQAGTTVQEKEPPPTPIVQEESDLPLRLAGTSATTPKDIYATAIILNEKENTLKTYAVGQQVMPEPEVTLEEIYPRKVILFNKDKNRRQVLRTDDEKARMQTASAQPYPSPTPTGRTTITVSKSEVVQELFMNYADIVTQIKPEMHRDASGKIAGITASNLGSLPLAKKLDMQDGDVLQSVNNEKIDSEQKVIELVNKYRNSNMVRIGLLRDGKPITRTYRLK